MHKEKAQKFVERWQERWQREKPLEEKHSQCFIGEFFGIFNIDHVASNIHFEYKMSDNNNKKADVLWPGVILIESKSPSNSDFPIKAAKQAIGYCQILGEKKPKYIVTTNFRRFNVFYLDKEDKSIAPDNPDESFSISELPQKIDLFYYFFDYEYKKTDQETTEKPVKQTVKEVQIVKEVVPKIRYGILILTSSLSLALGYIVSDGRPRTHIESMIEDSTGDLRTIP